MSMENDVVKKISELEDKKDIKGLEDIKLNAEAGFEGDIAGAAEKAIARLTAKAEEVSTTSPNQVNQIENLGGDKQKLEQQTEKIDNEIKIVDSVAEQKIGEIKNSEQRDGQSDNNIAEAKLEYDKEKLDLYFKKNKENGDNEKKNFDEFKDYISSEYNKIIENTKNQSYLIKNLSGLYFQLNRTSGIKKYEKESEQFREQKVFLSEMLNKVGSRLEEIEKAPKGKYTINL